MEDDSWVFDSLVGFLRGPVWNVPILTFIEHKSLVFEPGEDEKNEEEYRKIHDEYKNLVDFMLGSYMEDIGINPEQFEAACATGKKKLKTKFQQSIFEQVWASDDFEIFKRMMMQKNIELQLQALELLQQRYGILPDSLRPDSAEATEDTVMQQITMQSKEEHEAHVAALSEEEAEIEKALASSVEENQRLSAEKQTQEALLAEHFKSINIDESSGFKISEVASPVTFEPSEEVSPEEIEKRAAFLKAQRDKLLEMKRQEREKQLQEAEASQAQARPKSARAARSAFGRRGESGRQVIDPRTLEIRKALAKKLMDEVVTPDQE